jgi:uncharacterized membrane protein
MRATRIILFILAAGFLLFSFLFILAAFSPSGNGVSSFLPGVILALIGFALIFFGTRVNTASDQPDNVTLKIDLPGNVGMDTIKCKSCGGTLGPENIKMVAGAPVVTCPFCGTTYQLTEEPKW